MRNVRAKNSEKEKEREKKIAIILKARRYPAAFIPDGVCINERILLMNLEK